MDLYFFPAFHIYKAIGAVFKLKILLGLFVGYMEQDYFVHIMAQMLQSRKYFVFFAQPRIKHITEYDNQRALMYVFRYMMQGLYGRGFFAVLLFILYQ